MKTLGTPLGHPDYVQSFRRAKTEAQVVLLGRIPTVPNITIGMVDFARFCSQPWELASLSLNLGGLDFETFPAQGPREP